MRRSKAVLSLCLAGVSAQTFALDIQQENDTVTQWRTHRASELKSDTGWLTLAGLYWLQPGDNTFGSAQSNSIVLDNPALAATAGTFTLRDGHVHFTARPAARITHAQQPVTAIDLVADTQGEPTVLESGPLRFFVIERAGKLGIRVRDLDSPHRTGFKGLDYFPVQTDWAFNARFEPYEPRRRLKIINILGMEEEMEDWGAIVFNKDGKEWRLDAVLESPGDTDLFVMFRDATSGKETYGAGRFLHVPFPANGHTVVDFNEAYNPPCAFSEYATCPLPPSQNRLTLRIDAGEKKYAGGH